MSNPIGLIVLQEESAEVVIEICKADRFGFEAEVPWHPESKYEKGSTPKSRLEDEIGDWLGALDYCRYSVDIDFERVNARRKYKFEKICRLHGPPQHLQLKV